MYFRQKRVCPTLSKIFDSVEPSDKNMVTVGKVLTRPQLTFPQGSLVPKDRNSSFLTNFDRKF